MALEKSTRFEAKMLVQSSSPNETGNTGADRKSEIIYLTSKTNETDEIGEIDESNETNESNEIIYTGCEIAKAEG